MRLMMQSARWVLVSIAPLTLGIAGGERPELSVALKGGTAIEVAVVGGTVEAGWVLREE